jgi:transcription initiation factor TFIID TATA-box-binding protein
MTSETTQFPEAEGRIQEIKINVENVVASATLNQKLNLVDIHKEFVFSEYNPRRFPGLVFRLRKPKTSTLLFTTGKMVCTGAKSSKLAMSAVRKVVRELKKAGIIILRKPEIEVQNIVASGDLGYRIDLETGADLLENVMYEPEQFPGLIYRMRNPKTVLLVFTSGKIVCTGAKTEEMVYESVDKLFELLNDFDLFF